MNSKKITHAWLKIEYKLMMMTMTMKMAMMAMNYYAALF